MVEEFMRMQEQPISKEEAKYRKGIAVAAARYVVEQPMWLGYSSYLFGSLARGTSKYKSDIDLAFIPPDHKLEYEYAEYLLKSGKLRETVEDFKLQNGIYLPIRPVLIYQSWMDDPSTTRGVYPQLVVDINREGKKLV